MVVQELVKYVDASFFTRGISLISIFPNSACSYSFLILLGLISLISLLFTDFKETNFLISSSTTLPSFSLPNTSLIFTPNSLANFLAFGLAEEIS